MSDSEKKPWFSVFPSASQLPPGLNKPSFGFKMSEVDVVNCYNKAHGYKDEDGFTQSTVDHEVMAWAEQEAIAKGWQRIVWGDNCDITAIYPKGL